MLKIVFVFVIGFLFGIGILLFGMVNLVKVFNFFDVVGIWDFSFVFVMGGVLIVIVIGYCFVFCM